MAKKSKQNEIDKLTFEQSIHALTEIVDKIETGQVPLQESLQQYEKGMALIKHCRGILLNAEKRIEEIADTEQESGEDEEEIDEDQTENDDEEGEESLF